MTIIEAIKSGKAFKRPDYSNWIIVKGDFIYDEVHKPEYFTDGCYIFAVPEILADDWEVREE